MKDQAADKRSPIIAGALIISAVFLGIYGWLLLSTAMPTDCPSGFWLLDRLSCLSPNELGDTFAGAFAPVAFVWLVAAVMLQRNELAAQRQELRDSRSVATQQVEEAKRNAQFIGEQTEILRQTRMVQDFTEVENDLDEYAETLVKLMSRIARGSLVYSQSAHQINQSLLAPIVINVVVSSDTDPYEALSETGVHFGNSIRHFKSHYERGEVLFFTHVEELPQIRACLRNIEVLKSGLSPTKAFRLETARLSAISEALDYVEELFSTPSLS